jgi:hypothetical protein
MPTNVVTVANPVTPVAPVATDDAENAPIAAGLRACINEQNEILRRRRVLEPRTHVPRLPFHTLARPERKTSWLRSALNPLKALIPERFRRKEEEEEHVETPEEAAQRALDEAEDEHLARLAAVQLLPALTRRVAVPMNIHCLVLGCGSHGRNLAGELLRRGCQVHIYDNCPDTIQSARAVIESILTQHEREGLFLEGDVPEMLGRLSLVEEPSDALRGLPHVYIFEVVPDDAEVKRAVLMHAVNACIEAHLQPSDVMLCSSTLNLDLEELKTHLPAAYAPCLVGARIMHPCWFVDDAEVTLPSQYFERTAPPWLAVGACSSFFENLGFNIWYFAPGQVDAEGNCVGRCCLLYEEAVLYAVRQKIRVEADRGQTPVAVDLEAEIRHLSRMLAKEAKKQRDSALSNSLSSPLSSGDDASLPPSRPAGPGHSPTSSRPTNTPASTAGASSSAPSGTSLTRSTVSSAAASSAATSSAAASSAAASSAGSSSAAASSGASSALKAPRRLPVQVVVEDADAPADDALGVSAIFAHVMGDITLADDALRGLTPLELSADMPVADDTFEPLSQPHGGAATSVLLRDILFTEEATDLVSTASALGKRRKREDGARRDERAHTLFGPRAAPLEEPVEREHHIRTFQWRDGGVLKHKVSIQRRGESEVAVHHFRGNELIASKTTFRRSGGSWGSRQNPLR